MKTGLTWDQNPTRESGAILVADECWVALATLHRSNPNRESFQAREVIDQVRKVSASREFRAGVRAHIHGHCVANAERSSGGYRMFFRLPNGAVRLYRPGDFVNPRRNGKTIPNRTELPSKYHDLLDWYENQYLVSRADDRDEDDPVLELWGMGKEIWADTTADEYVADLRSGWDSPAVDPGNRDSGVTGQLARRTRSQRGT